MIIYRPGSILANDERTNNPFPSSLLKTRDGSAVSENSFMKGNPANDAADEKGNEIVAEKENEDAAGKRNKDAAEKGSEDMNAKDSGEEGIESIINFFKERIPGFQVKVLNVTRPEEVKLDAESLEQLVQEDEEKTASIDDLEDEISNPDSIQHDTPPVGASADSTGRSQNTTARLYIGGMLHNEEDVLSKSYMRVPAEIKNMEKDSFVMHIPGRSAELNSEKEKLEKSKLQPLLLKQPQILCLLML